jgi:hypothetical protein
MTDEVSDLDNLLKSPGWQRFEAAQDTYWRDTLAPHLRSVSDDTDDLRSLQKIRQVLAAHNAVLQALAWPRERLRQIQQAELRHAPNTANLRRGGV